MDSVSGTRARGRGAVPGSQGSLPAPGCPFPAAQLGWRAQSGPAAREAASGEEKGVRPTAARPPETRVETWRVRQVTPASPGCAVRAGDAGLQGCPVHGDGRNRLPGKKRSDTLVSPDAFDNELIFKTLNDVIAGKTVQIPVYDFVSHSR